jgi:hypothetical protein
MKLELGLGACARAFLNAQPHPRPLAVDSMTNAVIFGAAIVTVLNVPALSTNAYIWIPVMVVASLI